MPDKRDKFIDLQVAEIEAWLNARPPAPPAPPPPPPVMTASVRLKAQRPDDETLIGVTSTPEVLKLAHDAKKRGGTVWLRVSFPEGTEPPLTLTVVGLIVKDVLE